MNLPANFTNRYTGLEPYAVCVLKVLLRQHSTVPRISGITGFRFRTVRAQITALQSSDVVRKVREINKGRGGRWAVYGVQIDVPL